MTQFTMTNGPSESIGESNVQLLGVLPGLPEPRSINVLPHGGLQAEWKELVGVQDDWVRLFVNERCRFVLQRSHSGLNHEFEEGVDDQRLIMDTLLTIG